MRSIKRLHDNTTEISFFGNTTTSPAPTPLPKPYGVDGAITAYHEAGGNTWIYATMRRGGRALYAFDVTDPTTLAPMWKKSNADLSGLGQTVVIGQGAENERLRFERHPPPAGWHAPADADYGRRLRQHLRVRMRIRRLRQPDHGQSRLCAGRAIRQHADDSEPRAAR